jgi:hypothetical protein
MPRGWLWERGLVVSPASHDHLPRPYQNVPILLTTANSFFP